MKNTIIEDVSATTPITLALMGGTQPGASIRESRMFEVTRRGIRFPGDLKWPQYAELVRAWKEIGEAHELGLANLVMYGQQRFGPEKVEALFHQLEFDLADFHRALAIGQIPLDLWSDGLTSEHLYILGTIKDIAERNKWRLACEKHDMDAFTLKRSIDAGRVLTAKELETKRGSGTGIVTIHGIRHEFDLWQRTVGGEQAIAAFSLDEKRALLRELQAPGEMYLKLKDEIGAVA